MPLRLLRWLTAASLLCGAGAHAVAQTNTTRPESEGPKPAAVHAPQAADAARPLQHDAATHTERAATGGHEAPAAQPGGLDFMSMLFVFMLATFIGLGVILRVSRLLHTPLMSLTNAISAIAVVGAIIVAGGSHYPPGIKLLGAIALFASMTNIISGFLITDRMLKMFKTREGGKP